MCSSTCTSEAVSGIFYDEINDWLWKDYVATIRLKYIIVSILCKKRIFYHRKILNGFHLANICCGDEHALKNQGESLSHRWNNIVTASVPNIRYSLLFIWSALLLDHFCHCRRATVRQKGTERTILRGASTTPLNATILECGARAIKARNWKK